MKIFRTVSFLILPALLLAGCSKGAETGSASSSPDASVAASTTAVADQSKLELTDLGPAPDWSLVGLDGKPVRLKDLVGKVVIIDFWATFCPPCRAEIPDYIDLQRQYRDQGLVIVGLSVDNIPPMQVLSFVNKLGVNYPVAMADDATAEAYGIDAIPATFVLDRKGHVRFHKIGLWDKAGMERVVRALL